MRTEISYSHSDRYPCTMVLNRKKNSIKSSLIIHFPTSSGVSERTDKRVAQYLRPDSWLFWATMQIVKRGRSNVWSSRITSITRERRPVFYRCYVCALFSTVFKIHHKGKHCDVWFFLSEPLDSFSFKFAFSVALSDFNNIREGKIRKKELIHWVW